MDQKLLCFSLILMISGSVSVAWKMKVSPMVSASRGEDVVLNCSISPDRQEYSKTITVKWVARNQNGRPFFECSVKNDSLEGPHECLGSILQFSLFGDPRMGELSLFITDVQLTNIGQFFCHVELDGQKKLHEKIDLDVKSKPQILSLSVVNGTCGKQSSASRWLKCEAEGKPVPKIVWLSPSRRLLENQGLSFESVLWRTTACIPYLEEEVNQVITCRAENSDFAERSFPESKDLRMVVIVVNVVVLMSLSSVFAIVIICRRNHRQQQVFNPPAQGTELQPVYSEINYDPSAQVNSMQSIRHNGSSTDVAYSLLKVPQ